MLFVVVVTLARRGGGFEAADECEPPSLASSAAAPPFTIAPATSVGAPVTLAMSGSCRRGASGSAPNDSSIVAMSCLQYRTANISGVRGRPIHVGAASTASVDADIAAPAQDVCAASRFHKRNAAADDGADSGCLRIGSAPACSSIRTLCLHCNLAKSGAEAGPPQCKAAINGVVRGISRGTADDDAVEFEDFTRVVAPGGLAGATVQ